jgi:cobalamin biosynthesis protein CobD/CbiB
VLLAVAFDVAVLYLTLGFRQFSHYFTDIRDALDRGDETRPAACWPSGAPRRQRAAAHRVLRHVIEHALLAAHRHVFGVFFWFVCARRWAWGRRRGAVPHGRVRQPLLGLPAAGAGRARQRAPAALRAAVFA